MLRPRVEDRGHIAILSVLRSQVEVVRQQELKRVRGQLCNLTEQERAAVESLTHRLMDEVMRHLLGRIELAAQTDARLVEAARLLFLQLDDDRPLRTHGP